MVVVVAIIINFIACCAHAISHMLVRYCGSTEQARLIRNIVQYRARDMSVDPSKILGAWYGPLR